MNSKVGETLNLAIANKASDVHLIEGKVPMIRVNGQLFEATNVGFGAEGLTAEMITSILGGDQLAEFTKERELDFSLSVVGARFRTNIYHQQGLVAAALRVIGTEIPTIENLGLPEILHSFTKMKQGFVLVTGPTGHGKSTTVASMLDEINHQNTSHIVTIEDPVEYIIKPDKSIISQREVGSDTNGFARALRSVLRQDPNVVFVGEMRDLETISSALTVAETGHLVFSTLHTNSAAQTISRIIDVFPEGTKDQVRVQLAEVITAVISQRLVPTIDGGRVPATEILVATPSVKNTVREGKAYMIDNIIQTGMDSGMMGLETSLAHLVKQGRITEETALAYSLRPAELQSQLRSVKR